MVYRPNSSKVKNLKTKDYLGKARLIASSDKGNMFTGFAGAERRAIINADTSKDDRPPDSISFAASNLVRSDLTSRSQRQQSAPPINRNVFPPTPPPESDQQRPGNPVRAATSSSNPPSLTTRANSIRDGSGAGFRTGSSRRGAPPERRPTYTAVSPKSGIPANAGSQWGASDPYAIAPNNVSERPRHGTIRTASEPRGIVSKYSTARPDRGYRGDRDKEGRSSRGRLFMETTPRRDIGGGDEADIDEYPDELYDLYRNTAHSNPYTSAPKRALSDPRFQPLKYEERSSGGSSLDDFEMLNDAGGVMSIRARDASRSRSNAGAASRQVEIRTVRVKMRHGDDTRYLMVSTTIMFEEFLERVREKLNMKGKFKVMMKDEGDMITLGDRDDWEMALQTSRREARKAEEEMARMEVRLRQSLIVI